MPIYFLYAITLIGFLLGLYKTLWTKKPMDIIFVPIHFAASLIILFNSLETLFHLANEISREDIENVPEKIISIILYIGTAGALTWIIIACFWKGFNDNKEMNNNINYFLKRIKLKK